MMDYQFELDVKKAQEIVNKCQSDLSRELSNGERRDLLTDNTKWNSLYIRRIVGELRDN